MKIDKTERDCQQFLERQRSERQALRNAVVKIRTAQKNVHAAQRSRDLAQEYLQFAQQRIRMAEKEFHVAAEELFGLEGEGQTCQDPLDQRIIIAGIHRMQALLHQVETPTAELLQLQGMDLLWLQDSLFRLADNPKDASAAPLADKP